MRTDVKLGVVFALVMVLAAGGYFMFRGEKQTPILLADKAAGPEIKTQPTKPGSPAKSAASQPRTPTTNPNRPAINPSKPLANNANVPGRPVAPVVTPPVNKPAVTTPSSGSADGAANPVMPRPTPSIASPSGPENSSPSPAGNASPAANPIVERPAPAVTAPSMTVPTAAPNVPPAAPATGKEVGLTGIPNTNSQPANPATGRPTGSFAPLTNSPSAPTASGPTTSPLTSPATTPGAGNALPPGIRTANTPAKSEATIAKKSGVADAAVETHKVQVGDSLSSLSQTYYGSPKYAKFLADSNPKLGDPDRLKVGSLVSIPPLPTESDSKTAGGTAPSSSKPGDKPAADGKRTYTVKAGDSFYSIAKSQLGSASRWKELLALNNSTVNGDPTALQPGQRLILPESH